jgi:hypothetical protein
MAERLGHDIKTLMRTYAHVIRSDEDRVRSIVDESLGVSAGDWLRTGCCSSRSSGRGRERLARSVGFPEHHADARPGDAHLGTEWPGGHGRTTGDTHGRPELGAPDSMCPLGTGCRSWP